MVVNSGISPYLFCKDYRYENCNFHRCFSNIFSLIIWKKSRRLLGCLLPPFLTTTLRKSSIRINIPKMLCDINFSPRLFRVILPTKTLGLASCCFFFPFSPTAFALAKRVLRRETLYYWESV